jgi:hypothetical protein
MNDLSAQRQELLNQMSQIQRMEMGALCEQYREKLVDGQKIQTGPYFNHQLWKDGKNHCQYVPADKVAPLKEAIAARQSFEALSQKFIEVTVQMTRQQDASDIKKKTKLSKKPNSRKPKTSSD